MNKTYILNIKSSFKNAIFFFVCFFVIVTENMFKITLPEKPNCKDHGNLIQKLRFQPINKGLTPNRYQ